MSDNTNTTSSNTLHDLVYRAWQNTKEHISFVLEGAYRKHASPEGAGSKILNAPVQGQLEKLLFRDIKSWTEEGTFPNGKILTAALPYTLEAVMTAAPLEGLDQKIMCEVKELGAHPTLTTRGTAVTTRVVTAVVELNAGEDPDLVDFPQLCGKPILSTWFPGESTPPSHPENCKVGDKLTVKEALEKGWRTVCFVE